MISYAEATRRWTVFHRDDRINPRNFRPPVHYPVRLALNEGSPHGEIRKAGRGRLAAGNERGTTNTSRDGPVLNVPVLNSSDCASILRTNNQLFPVGPSTLPVLLSY